MEKVPQSRLRFGYSRADITPPVGINHRLWGAARHEQATGIHKPLLADIVALGPAHGSPACLRVFLDLVGLTEQQQREMQQSLSAHCDIPAEDIILSCSHTHAAGWFSPDRIALPGGDLIPAYLVEMRDAVTRAGEQALANMAEGCITYAAGRCGMAANRDFWDKQSGLFVCGYNPDVSADDTVLVARFTDLSGNLKATIVNYACHATTLAWQNTLISPDYPGAMREEMARVTGAPCIFAQGACGDLGPRYDYVGDTAVADQNGRWLAYSALAALASMGPPACDFAYQGPVVSGATLGIWTHAPLSAERNQEVSQFQGKGGAVDLPLKARPDAQQLRREMDDWLIRQTEADERSDPATARDCAAMAERARRWLARLDRLPEGSTYPLHYSVHRLGDGYWITCGGEPYNILQTELRRRFPDAVLLISPLSADQPVAYLLPRDHYGRGLYQEEPSILAPGCLEKLLETLSDCIAALQD